MTRSQKTTTKNTAIIPDIKASPRVFKIILLFLSENYIFFYCIFETKNVHMLSIMR